MDLLTVLGILATIVFVTWVAVTLIRRSRKARTVELAGDLQESITNPKSQSIYGSNSRLVNGGSRLVTPRPARVYVGNPTGYGPNGYNQPQYDSSGNLINTIIAYEIMSQLLADGSPNPNYDPNYVVDSSTLPVDTSVQQDYTSPSDPSPSVTADPTPAYESPQPSYSAPEPSYSAPEPSYSSSPSYSDSSSSYSDSSSSSSYDSGSSSSSYDSGSSSSDSGSSW